MEKVTSSLRREVWIVAAMAFMLFVPWLGDTYFYTKGEPREAIVAVSMLQSGDWVLPMSHGADIPYKPPFLAWLIAIFSNLFNHGVVNEFTSRLPSALAAVAMITGGWWFTARRTTRRKAWMMALITATAFEVFRAATACRVDMVLTACMVGAVYYLFDIHRHAWKYIPAILLLSGAVLTKGPVGALLPCLAMGIYMLLRGDNFFVAFARLVFVCAASMVLPALWYYAAWQEGGERFLQLAYEENIGRLTGTMSYESHINPWYYNVTALLAGLLPWTVPALIALCLRPVRRSLRNLRPGRGLPLMAWTVGIVIFIFYCIPASKRSVYLLPIYPFAAYGIAYLLNRADRTPLIHVWSIFLAVISIIGPLALIVLSINPLPKLPLAPLHWWLWIIAVIPALYASWWLLTRRKNSRNIASSMMLTYLLVLAYNASYMPLVLNAKSDAPAARQILETVPRNAQITGIIEGDSLMRYYSINFYLGDRLNRVPSYADAPADAWIITEPGEKADGSIARGDTLTSRSADTRRPVILIPPRHKSADADIINPAPRR